MATLYVLPVYIYQNTELWFQINVRQRILSNIFFHYYYEFFCHVIHRGCLITDILVSPNLATDKTQMAGQKCLM